MNWPMSAESGSGFHVLHIRSSAGLYGAEYMILGLVPALAQLGVDSTLLSIDNQYSQAQKLFERALALGVPARRLPCRGRFDFATVAAIRKLLARYPNALLHVHDYKSALNAWVARGRRKLPIVATSHGQFSTTASLHIYHRIESSLMRRFDHVGIVSEAMRPQLAASGVPGDRIRLVENGIDTRRFSPAAEPIARTEFGIAPDAIVFGTAMRLTEQKNPLGLVEAFASVAADAPRAALVIAGDGELRESVLARASNLGIGGRVHLAGARDDLERFYAMLDVFVLPSRYEGLPLALLEAMAVGRPVVATAVGQVPSVLEGLPFAPVPPNDVPALARAMRAAIDELGPAPALRQRVVERYSVQRMAAEYADVYNEVWSGRERAVA